MSTRATPSGTTGGRQPDLAIFGDGPAAEAFRTLRANIKFASGDHPARIILLADSGVGETHPTVAANLAVALAQAGDTTLLIDADLRRPAQHTIFSTANDRGVATFLQSSEAALPTSATAVPNLLLLPAGPMSVGPAELLASNRFQHLLTLAREAATFVIIDAPPINAVADALGIAAAADGVLLLVRAGQTRRTAAQRAKEQLLRVGATILGVVLTDARAERGAYKY